MYRRYENPYMIEKLIEQAEIAMQTAIDMEDESLQITIAEELHELNDRLRFAWDDDKQIWRTFNGQAVL